MKLPKKINILGINHKIIEEETDHMARNSWYGCINAVTREIHILPTIPEEYKKQTLMHEVIHAIDFLTNGSGSYELSEEQVERLATGILTVLKNNKVDIWL